MINKDNLGELLKALGFIQVGAVYEKQFTVFEATLKVDFHKQEIIYPEHKGLIINERQTCNFSSNENYVVLECVHRLLEKGYRPEHIELEPKWKVGHGASGGRADILIKDNANKSLLIIECKTSGKEHENAWKNTLQNGGQLFSYVQQSKSTQFICLYSSDLIDGKVVFSNHIITLKDNERLLEEKQDSQPLSYKDAQEVADLYQAWVETYIQDHTTKGIFEDDISAYNIGKNKFSLNDLKTISSRDIQGKYHEFATILRQHNVSGRENAFDKLVTLFLCKIVDESRNPDELKFYWKGIAYDSNFDLQDRLQLLYQLGMKDFLGEDVTYIDNAAIDEAFRLFRNDPDATRDTIKKYFRQLKFFTNNDFAFIDVHNEKLFYQNAVVLLKIVQMLQDIRLKTEEQNQFLGDMFEGFLDQGIKQSEGQYFTPMPIVKFIISSLPLENLIVDHEEPPKVIDYACGAGHFLNEYASQIAPIVEQYKTRPITDYHVEIVGIEKEYRLSKVAKVSAFMYGEDDIQIIYNDALAENSKIKDGIYSLLVANPPYSVKGFLETLSSMDRNRFELTQCIDENSYANNNSIEAFFIERAKQLLKADGVAGIIVPSSILTKGNSKITAKKANVYVATREILLKYFNIVAITEFGSGTFGKTGTNTVTLFLRRRKENPAPADHYRNRVESWFNGDNSKNGIFADEYLLCTYCNHLDYELDDYKTLLTGNLNDPLLNTEMFKEYRAEFDSLPETKNRKKQQSFRALSNEDQIKELDEKFLAFIQLIEKDKLYYFVLASLNPSEVIIVRSPSVKSEMRKFLGYEWSGARNNEGIKYLGGQSLVIENEEEGEETLEQDDKRVLENLLNLGNIQTSLYDPNNLANIEKINSLIRANYNCHSIEIPLTLKETVITAPLVDMLDFASTDFNKAIGLVRKKTTAIETKWDLVSLGNVCQIKNGATPDTNNQSYWENGTICWATLVDTKSKYLDDTKKKITQSGFDNCSASLLPVNSVILSTRATIGEVCINRVPTTTNQGYKSFICDSEKLKYEYLYYVLVYFRSNLENLVPSGTKYKEINTSTIRKFKVPLPPPNTQTEVVTKLIDIDENGIDFPKGNIDAYQNEVIRQKNKIIEDHLK